MNEWQIEVASIAITAPLLIVAAVVLLFVFCMAVKLRLWMMGVVIRDKNGYPVELVKGRWFLNAIRVLIRGSCFSTGDSERKNVVITDPDNSGRKPALVITSAGMLPDPGEGYELIPGHKAFGRVKVT